MAQRRRAGEEQQNADASALQKRLDLQREQFLADIRHFRATKGLTDSDLSQLEESWEASQSGAVGALQHLLEDLKEIDRAIERASSGGYGVCLDCGGRIPEARLEFLPTAVRCARCQETADKKLPRAG